MKKKMSLITWLLFLTLSSFLTIQVTAQTKPSISKETAEQKLKRMQWWKDSRFGMFIHWGCMHCLQGTSG